MKRFLATIRNNEVKKPLFHENISWREVSHIVDSSVNGVDAARTSVWNIGREPQIRSCRQTDIDVCHLLQERAYPYAHRRLRHKNGLHNTLLAFHNRYRIELLYPRWERMRYGHRIRDTHPVFVAGKNVPEFQSPCRMWVWVYAVHHLLREWSGGSHRCSWNAALVLGKFYSPRQSMNSNFLIIQWQGDDGEIIQNGDKREQLFGRIGGLNMEKRRGMRCTLWIKFPWKSNTL